MADPMDVSADEIPALDDTPDTPVTEARPSLDDVISKALDEAESEPSGDRARDEKGRFAPKAGEPTPSEAGEAPPEGTSETAPVVASTAPKPEAQPEISEGHFRGWAPEQVQQFKALPPEAQKIALDVVQGRDRFYSERIAEYEQAVNAARPLVNALQPHEHRIRQVTPDPAAYVAHVLDMDHRLQFAPYAEKVQLFAQLAQQIGVPFAPPEPDPFADPMSPMGQAYPVVHDLTNKVSLLEAKLQAYEAQTSYVEQQKLASTIHAFSSQTNADGSPKYPHFNEVRATMGQLLKEGKANTMEDAYSIAVKPIEDRISQEITRRLSAADAAKQAALSKARKAAPVRTNGVAPGGVTKAGGLDAIISAALDQAGIQ